MTLLLKNSYRTDEMRDHVVHNYFTNYHQPDSALNTFQRKVKHAKISLLNGLIISMTRTTDRFLDISQGNQHAYLCYVEKQIHTNN